MFAPADKTFQGWNIIWSHDEHVHPLTVTEQMIYHFTITLIREIDIFRKEKRIQLK